jgi:hypothetical protein
MFDQNDQQVQSNQTQDSNPYGGFGQTNNDTNSSFGFNPPQQPLGPPTTDQPTTMGDSNLDNTIPSIPNPVSANADDLLNIKQDALKQLNPLVQHLEQSPEEKFKTTMMMIQASDDQSLIKEAYDTAQKITDEKAKAQALLDIVNEINYFTQQNK